MLWLMCILFFAALAGWCEHHHPSAARKSPAKMAVRPATGFSPADAAQTLGSVVALSWGLVWLAIAFAPIGLLVWWLA